jgi:WD40 repeat protein
MPSAIDHVPVVLPVLAALLTAAAQEPADRPVRTASTRALVHLAAFAPDGATVLAWDSSGFARWNPETGKTVEQQPVIAKACGPKRGPVLPRSEDGRTLAVNCAGRLFFFDLATADARGEHRFDPARTPVVYTQSPDSAWTATVAAGATSTIELFDAKAGARRAVIENEHEVQQLSFSLSGQLLAAGAVDGVRVWQVPDGTLLRMIPGGTFHDIAPDGSTLAIERGRDVAIVELASGEVMRTVPAATLSQLRFSADGRVLAGWNNQQLTVWDVTTGKARLTLKASQLITVALARDARHLAAVAMDLAGGGAQTTLGVWRVPNAQ